MKTKIATQKQGLRYFASLTPKQKDNTVNNIKAMRMGVFQLPIGLRTAIMQQSDLDKALKETILIEEQLKGQKCFKTEHGYFPLNISKIIRL